MTADQKKQNLERKADGTITFTLIIPKKDVEEAYKKALSRAVEHTEIKGFRKGKAPENLVEKQVGKQKLYTDALQYSLPEAYASVVKENNLKPITNPKIEPQNLEEGQDWSLQVTLAEKPEIKLGDYKKIVTGAKAAAKIWIPGKDEPQTSGPGEPEKKPEDSLEQQLGKIFEALVKEIKFEIPAFLIEDETARLLSRLVNQLQKLGVNLDQYLMSINKSATALRKEYQDQSVRTLRLEFILNEIAHDLKVTVTDAEVDELIKAVGDEKLKKSLNTPTERMTIRESLRKRKVTDALLKL